MGVVKAGGQSDPKTSLVKHGGAVARIRQRGDGLWVVRWREAGRGRNTTLVSKERAEAKAKQIVRRLSASHGGQIVTVDDAQLAARMKQVAGERSPFVLLAEMEAAVKRLGGADALSRAIHFYEQSGMAAVERVTMRAARNRFLDDYERRSTWTRAGVRKEIDAFVSAHSTELCVCELTTELLAGWIARPRLNGARIGPRFFNNRLATWRTFLNRCRRWNFWPRGEMHPAELIEPRREPERMPPIWSVATLRAALAALRGRRAALLRYVAIGCWAGLRPTELVRIEAADFDFERRYIHVRPEVAMKTMQERYVPMEPCLWKLLREPAAEWPARGKVCLAHSRELASDALRAGRIISVWPQDVMRHSYISHRIARGDGIGVVAEHAGNSERVIRRSYRRPLMREDGLEWFAIAGR